MNTGNPPSEHQPPLESSDRAGQTTRLVATLVLVPTVPMLLLSVAALALFYLAPTRFGALLARLPGETFIRSALVFAPATLFAVVVLAVLYARDKPPEEVIRDWPGRVADQAGEPVAAGRPFPYTHLTARLVLFPAVPGLLFSIAVWGLSFVSPGRFDRLIEPLPGDRYLRPLVNVFPILLFFVVLVATFLAFPEPPYGRRATSTSRVTRLAVSVVLVSAVPTLVFSLAALGLFYFSPTRFDRLIAALPYEQFVRLALVFAPAVLLGVVLLAMLYLGRKGSGFAMQPSPPASVRRGPTDLRGLRSTIGLWVLVGGLTLTAVTGLGLLGVVLYLVLR
jgi:hypothetical protein